MPSSFNFTVSEHQHRYRLDHFLVQFLSDVSRSVVSHSVQSGDIRVDGVVRKCGYRLKKGQNVSGFLTEKEPIDLTPEKIHFDVLHEDSSLIVLSKPPGLVVHPAAGHPNGTLVNGLLYHCREAIESNDPVRPGIVHRLDKDTSGIMVVAKTESVHQKLVALFKARDIYKEYIALVVGIPDMHEGYISAAIGRHPVRRQQMSVQEHSGRYAVSNWQFLEQFCNSYSLLKVHIETGRTHQIRVHMAFIGHPVAGDVVYGKKELNINFPRQMLHASRLRFCHPVTSQIIDITAPLYGDFQSVITNLRAEDSMNKKSP